jgi:H+/Cl- antiporter ClcA
MMRLLPLSFWTGSLLLTANFQSSGQIGQVPWWLWLAIFFILLGFLIIGLFVRDDAGHRYPEIQQSVSGTGGDQISTGTELESDMSSGTAVSED